MKLPCRKLPSLVLLFVLFFAVITIFSPSQTNAAEGQASIYLSPSQGSFEVGSTFNVSVYVNTAGQSINAVRLDLDFDANLIQVADPTAGSSFISVWAVPPEYSNQNGTVHLQGGLPTPGINTASGLITTITFRGKGAGTASVDVLETSQVLANDGLGTDILNLTGHGHYQITIPAQLASKS